jgi:hypothetical protein
VGDSTFPLGHVIGQTPLLVSDSTFPLGHVIGQTPLAQAGRACPPFKASDQSPLLPPPTQGMCSVLQHKACNYLHPVFSNQVVKAFPAFLKSLQ